MTGALTRAARPTRNATGTLGNSLAFPVRNGRQRVRDDREQLLDRGLRLPAVALRIVVLMLVLLLFLAIDIELEHVRLATTLDPIFCAAYHKVQTDQHVLGIGLVDQIVFADVAESLAIQGIAESIDDSGLACAVAAAIAT